MASFFRASCSVYWLTWLVSLAYVIGITVYETKFVALTPEYLVVSDIIKLICYAIIGLAFVGCVFVKCDISHILCFLMYVIPLLLIIPGLCIYSLVKLREISSNPPTNMVLINLAKSKWSESTPNRQPLWLRKIEIDKKCCGIFSWKDYLVYIYGNNKLKIDGVEKAIPVECCSDYTLTNDGKTHCFNSSMKLDTDIDNRTDREKEIEESFYGSKVNETSFPFLNEKFKSYANLKGCNSTILKSFTNVNSSHFTFLIILMIGSLLMVVVYVKNWCGSRHFNSESGHSNHSLDIETLSLLDIPAVELSANRKSTRDLIKRPAVSDDDGSKLRRQSENPGGGSPVRVSKSGMSTKLKQLVQKLSTHDGAVHA